MSGDRACRQLRRRGSRGKSHAARRTALAGRARGLHRAVAAQRRLPHHQQPAQRAAPGEPAVPHGLGPDAGDPDRRARPVGRRQCRPVGLPCRGCHQVDRIALARRRGRPRLRRADRPRSTGSLVTALRVPPFIATYGMLWMMHGVDLLVHGRRNRSTDSRRRSAQFGSGYFLGIPIPIYLMIAVPAARHAVRAAHGLGAADLRDRRQSGRGAAFGHSGRAPAGAGLRGERRDGGARLAHLPCAR